MAILLPLLEPGATPCQAFRRFLIPDKSTKEKRI
jgi:hypothetical protein